MTHSYFTHGNAACSERVAEQPSTAATQWLSQLKTSTAGEPAFLSPYANVDVAALSHAGLDPNIQAAYQLGETVAGQILPSTFGTNGTGTGDGAVLKAAWPADGLADAGVLTSLANEGGISTVVLSSGELPSTSCRGGRARQDRQRRRHAACRCCSPTRGSPACWARRRRRGRQASQFALTQDFLAQTAMIAAEAGTSRARW